MYKTKTSVLTRLARLATASYLVIVCVACSSDNTLADFTDPNDLVEIKLSGELNAASAETRAPITGTKPTTDLPLQIFRADQSPSTYDTKYQSPFAATMKATTGIITPNAAQYYLINSSNTKLIALYPSGGTYNDNARTVTFTGLDGKTDIMTSQLTEGNRTTKINTMQFTHLLTQVRVNVKAEDGASDYWGTVSSISITGKKQNYVVSLPDPLNVAASTTARATITPSGTDPLLLIDATTDLAPSSMTLTATAQEFGYAMCFPVLSTEKLTLNVVTSKSTSETLDISQAFEAGTMYTIEITFKTSGISITSITATLTDWIDDSNSPIPGEIGG